MKVHHVEHFHLSQLQALRKSFGVIFFPSWMQRKRQEVIKNLLSSIKSAIIIEELLQITVDSTDEVLNYLINDMKITSLPYFQFFFDGTLKFSFEISDVPPEFSNPTFFYAPKQIPTIYEQALHSDVDTIQVLLRNPSDVYTNPLKLFISGDRSSVGKSSTCLALIATLVEEGISPCDISYIKPVTQCESEQAITRYCDEMQIAHQGIGPVVFYQGFTRAYLAGETEPANILIEKAVTSVNSIGKNKKIVIVDGVGYPAVGSICNISNGHVAQALQIPVLLIGKSGVGDAIDSYNLNAAFFESFGVHVLGGIFNKFDLTGFYNLSACQDAISSYFRQFKPHQTPYGYLPKLSAEEMERKEISIDEVTNSHTMITDDDASQQRKSNKFAAWINTFRVSVDMRRLIYDIWMANVFDHGEEWKLDSTIQDIQPLLVTGNHSSSAAMTPSSTTNQPPLYNKQYSSGPPESVQNKVSLKRSREEIIHKASGKGATGG